MARNSTQEPWPADHRVVASQSIFVLSLGGTSKRIKNIIHAVNASYDLGSVPDAGEMVARLGSIASRAAVARGVAITTLQRDISWDYDSEEAALSLSKRLRAIQNVTVEIIEIEE